MNIFRKILNTRNKKTCYDLAEIEQKLYSETVPEKMLVYFYADGTLKPQYKSLNGCQGKDTLDYFDAIYAIAPCATVTKR
ncbi:MAG: hypothetical protein RR086_04820 [Clostridia bacterium]